MNTAKDLKINILEDCGDILDCFQDMDVNKLTMEPFDEDEAQFVLDVVNRLLWGIGRDWTKAGVLTLTTGLIGSVIGEEKEGWE